MNPRLDVAINLGPADLVLKTLIKQGLDLTPVLGGEVNSILNDFFKQQFASEGVYGGAKWAPLAPVTLLARKRRGHGRGGILRDTNKLWASLTKMGLGPNAVRSIRPLSLTRGTSLKYAKWIQSGYVSPTFIVLGKNGQVIPLRRRVAKRVAARMIVPRRLPSQVSQRIAEAIARFMRRTHAQ